MTYIVHTYFVVLLIIVYVLYSYALSESTHTMTLYTQEATRLIADHAVTYPTTPMFMYFASQLLHTEWDVPQKYVDICHDAALSDTVTDVQQVYCAMNLMLDEVIGE